jgi:hydroxyacylglutathione hydrolase
VFVRRLVLGELQTNCWIVADDASGPAVVIDPAGHAPDAERIVSATEGRAISVVVLTHAHFDHLGAASALLAATGARLAVSRIDAPRILSAEAGGTGGMLFGFTDVAPEADVLLDEASRIEAGSLSLEVWSTPGHTAGSISLVARDPAGPAQLFSGDTLFAGSVGRTDFPAGDPHALARSIARLAGLPDSIVVHPGHGPDTTIGRERRANPFFPRA